tara:strand:+ start:1177 stop:1521 length:345 start_codon:yes stop_codon:yes gene_type:complete
MFDFIRDGLETFVFSQRDGFGFDYKEGNDSEMKKGKQEEESQEEEESPEGFASMMNNDLMNLFLISLFILIIFFILGTYLWNNYLIKAIPGIKPLSSVTQFIAIWFVTQILFTK